METAKTNKPTVIAVTENRISLRLVERLECFAKGRQCGEVICSTLCPVRFSCTRRPVKNHLTLSLQNRLNPARNPSQSRRMFCCSQVICWGRLRHRMRLKVLFDCQQVFVELAEFPHGGSQSLVCCGHLPFVGG